MPISVLNITFHRLEPFEIDLLGAKDLTKNHCINLQWLNSYICEAIGPSESLG